MRNHITCKNLNGAIIVVDTGYPLEQGFFFFYEGYIMGKRSDDSSLASNILMTILITLVLGAILYTYFSKDFSVAFIVLGIYMFIMFVVFFCIFSKN